MASIINRKGSYYSRVQWRDEDGIMREKQIPLKTKKKRADFIIKNDFKKKSVKKEITKILKLI